jgi:hypothetical protein
MLFHDRAASRGIRAAGLLVAALGLVPASSSARAAFQSVPAIQVPNLVGYWCVDGLVPDTATTAQDSSGNGNAGTYTAGATTMAAAPPVPGGNLKSFLFNQAGGQYISVPDSPSLSLTGAFTLAAWIRPTIDSSVQEGIIEKYDDASGIANGYSFRLDANENLSFSVMPAAGGGTGVSTAPRHIPLNAWTHVAGVYDTSGGTLTNYVNAAADPSTASGLAPPTDGSNSLQIGKDYGGNAFNGNIDEVRIYNRALSADEIGILKDGQPAPTGLTAAGAPGENLLSWNAPTNAGLVTVQYSVLRGTSSGAYDTVFNNILTTSFADTSAAPGTAYFYAVVAVSVMASDPSPEQSATASAGSPAPSSSSGTATKSDSGIHSFCGSSSASPAALSPVLLAALLAVVLLLRGRRA